MIKLINLRVDLSDDYINKDIIFHEGDINGTEIVLAVYDNNSEFDLTGCTAEYDATIDGCLAEEAAAATISDTNKINVPVTANMTAINGLLLIDVKIKRGNDILTVYTVSANVKRAVINGATIIDIDGKSIMQKIKNAVPNTRTIAGINLQDDISAGDLGAAIAKETIVHGTNFPVGYSTQGDIFAPGCIYVCGNTENSPSSNGLIYILEEVSLNGVEPILYRYHWKRPPRVVSGTTLPTIETRPDPDCLCNSYQVGDVFCKTDSAGQIQAIYLCHDMGTALSGNGYAIYNYGWVDLMSGYLVTSLSSSSTDSQIPTAKCVYDLIGDIESLLAEV